MNSRFSSNLIGGSGFRTQKFSGSQGLGVQEGAWDSRASADGYKRSVVGALCIGTRAEPRIIPSWVRRERERRICIYIYIYVCMEICIFRGLRPEAGNAGSRGDLSHILSFVAHTCARLSPLQKLDLLKKRERDVYIYIYLYIIIEG